MDDCILPLNDKHAYFVCKLELGSIPALEKQLTTSLDISCLDKESWINCDDDSASHLFHRVHHIYNRINIAKSCEQEVDGNSLWDKIIDVLDKVMDYKSSDIVPNMDDHVFDDDYEDGKADNGEHDIQINQTDASMIPCLLDIKKDWMA